MKNSIVGWAGVFGLLSVALGAFGTHALKGQLDTHDLEIYHTAVQYQMFHSLALLGVGILNLKKPALFFIFGMLIFSGSLYLLVFTQQRWLGAITPIGGISLMLGWGGLAWHGLKRRSA